MSSEKSFPDVLGEQPLTAFVVGRVRPGRLELRYRYEVPIPRILLPHGPDYPS